MFCFKSGSSHSLYMQCLAELVKVLVPQSSELRLPGRSVLRRSSALLINSPSMFFVSPITQTPAASALEPPPLRPGYHPGIRAVLGWSASFP